MDDGPSTTLAGIDRFRDWSLVDNDFVSLGECRFWRHIFEFPAVGKPRMTQRDRWKVRNVVAAYRAWCDSVRGEIRNRPPPPSERIVRLDWVAGFALPASMSKACRAQFLHALHRVRPDRDNIDKAILDTLFESDQHIACGSMLKVWVERPFFKVEIFWR